MIFDASGSFINVVERSLLFIDFPIALASFSYLPDSKSGFQIRYKA